MATATYVQGGISIDYTPGTAVDAGDVIVQGDLVGIATQDIAANVLGALTISGVFDVAKATDSASAVTAGAKVYWDSGNEVATTTAGDNKQIGKAVAAATAAASTVRVLLSQ